MTEMTDLYARTDSGLAAYAAGFLHSLPPGLRDVTRHQRAVSALLAMAGIDPDTITPSNDLDDANIGVFVDGQRAGHGAARFFGIAHGLTVYDDDDRDYDSIEIAADETFSVAVHHADGSHSFVVVRADEDAMMRVVIDANPDMPYELIERSGGDDDE